MGHSFGASTALDLAVHKHVHASIVLDPWYLMRHVGISATGNYHLDPACPPTLIIRTADFPREIDKDTGSVYSQAKCTDVFMERSLEKCGKLE
jgi:hypothetical protein